MVRLTCIHNALIGYLILNLTDMLKFNITLGFGDQHRRAKFEKQIEAQLPSLFRMARGIVDQQSDAEDLVHDTCVKALAASGPAEFDNEVSLRSWLKHILINLYRDQYRRAKRAPVWAHEHHTSTDDNTNIVELVASTELSPPQCIENRNSSKAIHNAFSLLPPEVRVVSVLFLINQHSYKEIAYITDCPIGTVMSRLSRGRQLLKERLSAYDPGDGSLSFADKSRGEEL